MGPQNRRRRCSFISSHSHGCRLEALESRTLLSTAVMSGRPLPTVSVGSAASVFLSESTDQAAFGAGITFVAHVLSSDGSSTDGTLIDFVDNTSAGPVVVGTQKLTNNSAMFTWSTGLAGTHSITAQLETGQAITGGGSVPQDVTIAKAETVTTLAEVGGSVVATVTFGGVPAIGGSVSFFEGTKVLGTVRVLAEGTAAIPVSGWRPGTHAIVAAYNGTGQLGTSTSAELEVTINGALNGGQGSRGVGSHGRGHWAAPVESAAVRVHRVKKK